MKNIALIFDFDETLVEESTSALIESLGVDVNWFWSENTQALLEKDWDPVPAYMYKLIELSMNKEPAQITKQSLVENGKNLKFKPGVSTLFKNLKEYVSKSGEPINLEFYIISSGIGEVIRSSSIAKHFTDIWASDFEYNLNGEIIFPKKVLSFTDKTRYIFQISKGQIGEQFRNKPYIVNNKVEPKDFRTKIENMIYIGDGLTDIPCFSLLKKYNGATIAVYDAQNMQAYGKAWRFVKDDRVNNLNSANYTIGSDLYNSIIMALNDIINK